MARPNKIRISAYMPKGFAIALKAIALMTGESVSELTKRILADGIKAEGSALLVMNKFLEYGLSKDKFPPSLIQELDQLDSDRRCNDEIEVEIEIEE